MHCKGRTMTGEQFAEAMIAKGYFTKRWVEGKDERIIATHESKPGIDISLNSMTDAQFERAEVFKTAFKSA